MIGQGMLGDLNETGKERTQVAKRSITRLVALINDLLDLERLRCGEVSLNKQSIDLNDVVKQSIDSVKSFAENHKVALEAQKIDAKVNADSARLVQVLVNLISNAVKFSPENSKVSVAACTVDGFVELQVQDQGRGVPEHLQEAIFDRFKQVKTSDATEKGGTGLGLAICRSLVEQHQGTIGVRSKDGEGSTFWFRIPLDSEALTAKENATI